MACSAFPFEWKCGLFTQSFPLNGNVACSLSRSLSMEMWRVHSVIPLATQLAYKWTNAVWLFGHHYQSVYGRHCPLCDWSVTTGQSPLVSHRWSVTTGQSPSGWAGAVHHDYLSQDDLTLSTQCLTSHHHQSWDNLTLSTWCLINHHCPSWMT